MRYIDTGGRDPAEALGSWLKSAVGPNSSVRELRWQTGFFNSAALGLFAPTMKILADEDGVLKLLVGSNKGSTLRADIELLLAVSGPPRKGRELGVVKFDNAYFHPKTIHVVRKDGSQAAYVGSGNLTANGITSLNIEAGVILDTKDGDHPEVLAKIKKAIDRWFAILPAGLNLISKSSDLDALVKSGTLDVPPPPPSQSAASKNTEPSPTANLKPLLSLPKLLAPAAATPPKATATAASAASPPDQWLKQLSASDAQRKPTGKQRGGITLVKAGHPIDSKTYFRYDFFKSATWVVDLKQKAKKREHSFVPFEVDFLGKSLGTIGIEISYEKGREFGQGNYTSELHLGPVLSAEFKAQNVTGRWLRLVRDADGGYALSVLASAPKPSVGA